MVGSADVSLRIRNSDTSLNGRTPGRPTISRAASSPLLAQQVSCDSGPRYNTLKHRVQDSITSIRDDPFFRNYSNPNSDYLARQLRSVTAIEARNAVLPEEHCLTMPIENMQSLPAQSRSGMTDINVAIIGQMGGGKSTFIRNCLGLRALPTSIHTSLRMSLDNLSYTVTLIELDLEYFDTGSDRVIEWPKQINGHIVPPLDGALLLYDVMNKASIAELPQTLAALGKLALPTILVACKCDNPENTRQLDVENVALAFKSSCVEALKTAANVPESARSCLSSILRAVMANRAAAPLHEASRRRQRAISSAHLEMPPDPQRPLSQHSKHSRASSEYSMLRGFPSPPLSSRGPPALSRSNGRSILQQFNVPENLETPPLSAHPAFRLDTDAPSASSTPTLLPERTFTPLLSAGRGEGSFLDTDESDAESAYLYSTDTPIMQRNEGSFFNKPAKVIGISFEELVDRLVAERMSRADNNFADIFLCLYRKFAAPAELFSAIVARLDRLAEDRNIHYLTRTAAQLRIVTIIAKWVASYPGDFASPSTSQRLEKFIDELSSEPIFVSAAQEMRTQLQSKVVEDDDTGWARTDADVDIENGGLYESAPAPSSPMPQIKNNFEVEFGNLTLGDESEEAQAQRQSSNFSGRVSPAPSFATSFHTFESYEREAATMVPRGTLPLTKFRYHIFMDTADDDFADEMTRIDWVMFSSIRLRDLVRHVSLPLEQKEKCKSLASVNRMISHFNHIAQWVASMILMRDKAKHRALMLEKFMNIALKLRRLNNYNGLAAVLAGINGSSIHRLAQTRALVPADVTKSFARLVLLMSTQKSHFAYRLAWENSPLPRIPFIPLHRRDLVSAEEGSRTFVGDNGERINWKKFEILSEVILPIMKSQVMPYPNLTKHDQARELILDCRLPSDDEEVYQRSVQVESSATYQPEGKKKFPWFSKDKY